MAGNASQFPHQWLKEKCPTYSGPFDTSKDLLLKLQQLEQINVCSDKDADEVLNILSQVEEQYTALAQHNQSILDGLKLSVDELLKKSGSRIKNSFSEDINLLDTKKGVLTNIDKRIENARLNREKSRIKREGKLLEEKTADYDRKIARLQRELELSKNEIKDMRSRLKQKQQDESKMFEAESKLQKFQDELTAFSVTEEMYPEVLVEKFQILEEMKLEVENLKDNLVQYGSLPPDLLLAREELRRKMFEEEKLSEMIRKMALQY